MTTGNKHCRGQFKGCPKPGLFNLSTRIIGAVIILIFTVHVPGANSEEPAIDNPGGNEEKSQLTATYIGHATVLLDVGGNAILTDPVFSDKIPGRKRHLPPGLTLSALPALTAIVISHSHYDHFDLPTLEKLSTEVPIIVPPGIKGLARRLKDRTFVELKNGSSWKGEGVKITAVPARHQGGRWMIDSFFRPANGYIIEGEGGTVYFAGDTARKNDFTQIGRRFHIDLALLPIGAYSPRWIMKWGHIGPGDALDVFSELQAECMVPIHWGVFKLSLEPLAEPVIKLEALAAERNLQGRVILLRPGEVWRK